MTGEIIVLVTCETGKAESIAKPIIEERLAACVNIIAGVRSLFTWKGNLSQETEDLLIIKSTSQLWGKLENRIRELHSYEVPEIIAVEIERGYKAYLDWLNQSVVDS